MGEWLTVQPSTVNGTELGVQECIYALFLIYFIEPPDLTKFYDGCNTTFSIFRALECKKGGLVTERHNEFRDDVADLSGKAFMPTHVHYKPLICAGLAMQRPNTQTPGTTPSPLKKKPEDTEHKGYILIHDLWQNGTYSVHNMRVMNTDAKSYLAKDTF